MFGVNYKPLVLLHLAMQQLLDLLEPLIFQKISHLVTRRVPKVGTAWVQMSHC
jgi:hypothetical protein